MIPKKIHFCWFGGNEYPDIVKECMDSWVKKCPDYEIVKWNETNFDINQCPYVAQAYEAKKWAFVSDYARLKILYENGGVYLDTDVELLKSIDELLSNKAFMGFEHGLGVNSGLICGSEKGVLLFRELIDIYERTPFRRDDGTLNLKSCVEYTTELLVEKGLVKKNCRQVVQDICIYPIEYFCPKNQFTEKVNITDNTYTFHRYIGTWADDTVKYGQKLKKQCIEKHGSHVGKLIYTFKYSVYVVKTNGILSLFQKLRRKISVTLKYR